MQRLRAGLVVNARLPSRTRSAALARLRERVRVVAELEMRGDDGDLPRLVSLLAGSTPELLVAAGGDGTVSLALRALLRAGGTQATALAFLPLGTGNNAARSFGLRSLREGRRALELALAAIAAGPRREVDVGLVDERPFLGSVAIGMDADVLSLRNRARRRLGPAASGYGLYLGGALVSLLSAHGGRARLTLDGSTETRTIFNLAVVNAPVYAGPLRFDGENDVADGRLDLLAVESGWQYLAEYPSAWIRFLRVLHGGSAQPSLLLRRAKEIQVAFDHPVAAQADGEEIGPSATFRFGVLPRVLRVCVPG